MIIFGSLIILTSLGLFIIWKTNSCFGGVLTVASGFTLLGVIAALPIYHFETGAEIDAFKAVQITIEQARKSNVNFETVAIQHKIIECNKWLAKKKYYNSSIMDLWVPDEISKLSPIK